MLVSAAALTLRSMAKSSGPLSALERAEREKQRQRGQRHEEKDVARVDETALERVEVLAQAELADDIARHVGNELGGLSDDVQQDEHDERDEKRDDLAVRDAGNEE